MSALGSECVCERVRDACEVVLADLDDASECEGADCYGASARTDRGALATPCACTRSAADVFQPDVREGLKLGPDGARCRAGRSSSGALLSSI